jgi:hypothetical protein
MPRLSKTVLAHTFELDCDRYLRFKLASHEEAAALDLAAYRDQRPGAQPQMAAGRQWETAKYQDLVDVCPPEAICCALDDKVDPDLGRPAFIAPPALFETLNKDTPPRLFFEAEFAVPDSFAPGLRELYERHGLDPVKARPDILWIRPFGASPAIGAASGARHEIHIVDIKRAAEPSMKHFTEVTFYALALARALELAGLSDRYAVSAQGYIWPGNHDDNAFRDLHARFAAADDPDPLTAALESTLVPVPHEVYHVHVRRFFEERLPRVLAEAPADAAWHVIPLCRGCEYVRYCRAQAKRDDHLSRVPWLSRGQAAALRRDDVAITTTRQLTDAIASDSPAWQRAKEINPLLRGEAALLRARAMALHTGEPHFAENRVWPLMPRWTDMDIYITIQSDPGTGITFAMGAGRRYRPPGAPAGETMAEYRVFVVDRAPDMTPETEGERLADFIQCVCGWLMEAHKFNRGADKDARKARAQVFVWEPGEIRQLKRMLQRHMDAPGMTEAIQLLLRLFPPDDVLPDPDAFKSQPYTVVKEAFRQLVGLPLPHDYTLLDTVDAFYPLKKKDGTFFTAQRTFGYYTDLSDQIPFERAYELWTGRVTLRHPARDGKQGPLYTRDELVNRLKHVVSDRLYILKHVTDRLRANAGERLTLKKGPFSAAKSSEPNVPVPARRLLTFERLNTIVEELENRQARALPVEEREARFIAMRGLLPADGPDAERLLDRARAADPEHAAHMLVFTFSPNSRDARMKEGDFLLALTNEQPPVDLDMRWWTYLGKSFAEVKSQVGYDFNEMSLVRATMRRLLEVSLVRLDTLHDPPLVVLRPNDADLFAFARHVPDDGAAILDFSRPMVLDILYRDFHYAAMEDAMKAAKGVRPRPVTEMALPAAPGGD